ncbi:MAG: DUF3540 domain-containing protein [Myxococcales bacterium]|nr:DUF3540 domain-containing protein [Myxococcales bacterium]
MSNAVARLPVSSTVASPRLGPATVRAVLDAERVTVERARDGVVREARLAMPMRYEPVAGDVLLVIDDDDAAWVIGVIDGRGHTHVEARGPLTLRSRESTVAIEGHQGIRLEAPEVSLRSAVWELVTERANLHARSLHQRVSELLHTHAGTLHTLVRGHSLQQSKAATVLTDEKLVLNGKAIHLG